MANLRAVNETYQLDYNSQPRPAYVSLRIQPRTPDSDEPYNRFRQVSTTSSPSMATG